MQKTVLDVSKLGKCYPTYKNSLGRFAEWFGLRAIRVHEYWAAKDVTFSLGRGEALAIIGQNGAGKSTLLKLIAGTVRPSRGTIHCSGRVSAILELGLGFAPDFTGRQNVYLAGGLMGLSSAQLAELIPSIEDFAEIGEFFDQPLRVYSSGMQARLAFSVATAVRPEVLIVDEVLSVGDSYFQHKSFGRIRTFKEQGTSIILVTHSLDSVRSLCDRAILLDKGFVLMDGKTDEVVDYYNALIAKKENAKLLIEQRRQEDGWLVTKSGTGEVRIESVDLVDAVSGKAVAVVDVGQQLEVRLRASVHDDIPRLVLGYMIRNKQGHVVWGTNTWHTRQVQEELRGGETIEFRLSFTCTLGPGSYSVSPALSSSDTHLTENYAWVDNMLVFDVVNMKSDFFIGSNWLDARFVITRQTEKPAA